MDFDRCPAVVFAFRQWYLPSASDRPLASDICLTASDIPSACYFASQSFISPVGRSCGLIHNFGQGPKYHARNLHITFSRKAENITLAEGQNITQNPLFLSSLSARKALSFAQLYEIVVDAAPIQQLFVRTLFGDFPFGHDDDLIRRADGI